MIRTFCTALFILISGFIVSCTNVPGETPVSKDPTISNSSVSVSVQESGDIKNAVEVLKQYSDTANIAWKNLLAVDSVRMIHLDKLIEEFSRSKGSIAARELEELRNLRKELRGKRLTAESQYNNALVHHYDVVSDSLTTKTLRVYDRLKSLHKARPAMITVSKSIISDGMELKNKRAQYNEAAKKYNDFFWEKRTLVLQAKAELPSRPIRAYFHEAI